VAGVLEVDQAAQRPCARRVAGDLPQVLRGTAVIVTETLSRDGATDRVCGGDPHQHGIRGRHRRLLAGSSLDQGGDLEVEACLPQPGAGVRRPVADSSNDSTRTEQLGSWRAHQHPRMRTQR